MKQAADSRDGVMQHEMSD